MPTNKVHSYGTSRFFENTAPHKLDFVSCSQFRLEIYALEPVVDVEVLDAIWRTILPGEVKNWVIFKYGTTVLCRDENKNPSDHAIEVMSEHGAVVAGTPLGDFNVGLAHDNPGWVVVYSHDDIGNYVSPDELDSEEPHTVEIGLTGRAKRHADYEAMEIIHVHSE